MADLRKQRMLDKEGRNTSSNDPKLMRSRIFIGNLAAEKVSRQEVEARFSPYGKILGVSLHKSYGFVQFDNEESAEKAVAGEKGSSLHGMKMDINIATERRKDPSTRRSPPPRGSRSKHMWRDDGWSRHSPPLPPPPPFRRRSDRYRDPYYSPPDLGYQLHDDPFDPYPPDPYMRPPPLREYGRGHSDYGPPSPLPPLRERFSRDRYEDIERDREMHGPPSLPPEQERRSIDMEIIVVNRQQRQYAELVRDKVTVIGLRVSIVQLSLTVSLAIALEDAAKRGLLYTVIITAQHEAHRSITLTILRGRNPQEHKNMPLEDALGLIERDYNHFVYGGRSEQPTRQPPAGGVSPRTNSTVASLMSRAASGEQLNNTELALLISSLQQQQQTSKPIGGRSFTQDSLLSGPSDSIQRQQADLQAKILNLLGSSAVVPGNKPLPAVGGPPTVSPRVGYSGSSRYTDDTGPFSSDYGGYGGGSSFHGHQYSNY